MEDGLWLVCKIIFLKKSNNTGKSISYYAMSHGGKFLLSYCSVFSALVTAAAAGFLSLLPYLVRAHGRRQSLDQTRCNLRNTAR